MARADSAAARAHLTLATPFDDARVMAMVSYISGRSKCRGRRPAVPDSSHASNSRQGGTAAEVARGRIITKEFN
jgi:hypothetical protein